MTSLKDYPLSTFLRDNEVDDHGRASGQRRLRPDVEVVDGLSPHERHLTVSVSVNSA